MESVCFVEDLTAHGLLGKDRAHRNSFGGAPRREEREREREREREGFVPRAVSESEPLEA